LEKGGVTFALVLRRHEHPLESAPGNSVHLGAKAGVGPALFTSSWASSVEKAVGVGPSTSRFLIAGKVALRAGMVVTLVTVLLLCPYHFSEPYSQGLIFYCRLTM
jgi:hypothetical protein